MARPSESVQYNRAKRNILMGRLEELVAEGMSEEKAARELGYNYSTIKYWKKQRAIEEERQEAQNRLTLSCGSFSGALQCIKSGQMVRRHSASWFLQLVDGKICLYTLDGAGNRRYSKVASFGSADVLAMDWELVQ
jgi:hypothetical protein